MLEVVERLVCKYGVNMIAAALMIVLVPVVIIAHAGVYALLERAPYPQWYLIDAGLTLVAGLPVVLLLLHYAEKMNKQKSALSQALSKVRELEAILPMCAGCKKIRDQDGCWHDADYYISENTNSKISHGLCGSCADITLKQTNLLN